MKTTCLFLVFVTALVTASFAQSATVPPLSGDPQKDLPLLLKPGIHLAEVIGRKQFTGPFTVIGHDTLEIIRQGNIISFKGRNRLRPLDSVRIDLAAKQVLYRGEIVPYTGVPRTTSNDNDENPLRMSAGHEFSFEEDASDVTPPDTGNITPETAAAMMRSMTAKHMSLAVGRLKNSNKTGLLFMATKITKGKAEFAVAVPLTWNSSSKKTGRHCRHKPSLVFFQHVT